MIYKTVSGDLQDIMSRLLRDRKAGTRCGVGGPPTVPGTFGNSLVTPHPQLSSHFPISEKEWASAFEEITMEQTGPWMAAQRQAEGGLIVFHG